MDLSSLEEGRVDNLNGFEVLFLTGVFTAFKEFHFLSLALIVYVRCVNVFVFFFFFSVNWFMNTVGGFSQLFRRAD